MKRNVFWSIGEIVEGIWSKKMSPVEVVDVHLRRAEAMHPKLNAFVHLDAAGARERARAAEGAVMRRESLGPLHGVPLTVKSCIDVAGWRCPAGSALRKDYVAQQDAVLVARLKKAGAILLGNTNTPEFLMNYETDNAVSGKTNNPWNVSYSAGGSSGGEAPAIASGCSAGGVGSDGGGSIRARALFGNLRTQADAGSSARNGTFSAAWRRVFVDRRGGADGANGCRCADAVCGDARAGRG